MATLHEEVLAKLGPLIISGSLTPGSTVNLEWVQQEFNVSRTVAREVVQVLASMRLVASRRRTGVTVLSKDQWDNYDRAVIRWRLAGPERGTQLHQLSQLRSAIEPPAAALAARHAVDRQRDRIVELGAEMEAAGAAGDLTTFLEHDIAYHRLLLDASGNAMFAGLADVVEEVLRGRTRHHLMPARPKAEARRLHLVVAEAVAGGESEVARAAMTAICVEVTNEMGQVSGRGDSDT
ncbi:FadR/GntR family transcriptional regulator [Actinophytocola algeriensis]|uniref:DNA-binding FadR family transcriptional regulator n=1 Tax=Actinophytocola algeriensis TaxID=1768010 RepID=A0A7W7Q8C6_9PSEU|nr:FCD domain-containing protein [Actinophytocola algeriensis]MBB4908920.1 DNA-binding FadR family transcriptional regulator [Actinophytocola algeriensis]MBE1474692.1 DNA-binding FadR family transcriptional regulator [Actinophytocola algeriensis]